MSGNASWALGVIPEEEIDNPMFFFTELKVGVNSRETTRSSLLPREKLQDLWVEIVLDVPNKLVVIRLDILELSNRRWLKLSRPRPIKVVESPVPFSLLLPLSCAYYRH